MTGDFRIGVDEELGVVLIRGTGFWSVDVLDCHFEALAGIVARLRCHGAVIRALVDMRQADLQLIEVVERISMHTARIYVPRDRVAIVVASSLPSLQMRGSLGPMQHAFFISLERAMAWLCAPNADDHGISGSS